MKAIVDAHDGDLSIESDAGRGATVTVRLARHDAGQPVEAALRRSP